MPDAPAPSSPQDTPSQSAPSKAASQAAPQAAPQADGLQAAGSENGASKPDPASLGAAVARVLEGCLAGAARPVSLHTPVFEGREWAYVRECIDTGWVSSAGAFVGRLEEALADYTGAAHAVAVVNGTAALHVALRLAGVERGDEVLVPALSFVATANAVAYLGAVPHFVDSEEATLGLDPGKLGAYLRRIAARTGGAWRNRGTGRRLAAVVPMHAFGHPVRMAELKAVAGRYDLPIVEDAAEALGSRYQGAHAGTIGRVGTLSFNGNKTITTGGGGALLTDDVDLARRARHLVTTAKRDHPYEYVHDRIGYNYRMPNLNAALGCAQLERADDLIDRKRALAARYRAAFAGVDGVRVFGEAPFARSNYWLNALLLDSDRRAERNAVLGATRAAGFLTRPAWRLLSSLPMYRGCPQMDLTSARSLEQRLVNLPSTPTLANLPAP